MHEPTPRNLLPSLSPLERWIPGRMGRAVRSLLGFDQLNDLYQRVPATCSAKEFCTHLIAQLGVSVDTDGLSRIPSRGPAILVSNHPFGALDGLILGSQLLSVRPDVKILANHLLAFIPELRELCIFVDPFDGDRGRVTNYRGLIEALRFLRGGGMIATFPSGEVAHWCLRKRRVTESDWKASVAGLARRSGATVVPAFFEGRNCAIFHLGGLIHPRIRTALLPRAVLAKQNQRVRLRLGSPITAQSLAGLPDDRGAASYLRLRSHTLGERRDVTRDLGVTRANSVLEQLPIGPAVPPHQLEHDLRQLPPQACLARSGDLAVYEAKSTRIPNLMKELGRLREVTFRAVGEGTGRSLDLDEFDRWYRHLLVWNHSRRELVGAYRVGRIDRIVRSRGLKGLYTSTLFAYDEEFLRELGPALELGRSFVRPEYQRTFTPLLLLWKGIGTFLARHPRYRRLVGPVTISGSYQSTSQAMMVAFLSHGDRRSRLARLVTSRSPFVSPNGCDPDVLSAAGALTELEQLSTAIQDIEPEGRGVPILLKQYSRLGAKTIAFNVDPNFSACLDCLCVVDVLQADRRAIRRYMGDEPADRYFSANATAMACGVS